MQADQANDATASPATLCVALELSTAYWKLALQDGKRARPATAVVRATRAGERLKQALAVIEATKREWESPADTQVVAAYQLGEDGFWIARALRERGLEVKVVDTVSLPARRLVNHGRTDRIDAVRLLDSLRAWLGGQHDAMRVVEVPSQEEEMRTILEDEQEDLEVNIALYLHHMREVLDEVGCTDDLGSGFKERLAEGQLLDGDGQPLSAELQSVLLRDCERLALARRLLQEVDDRLSQ